MPSTRAVEEAARDRRRRAERACATRSGTINLKPLAKLTDADFARDFAVNALGAARAVQAALPALKAAEGTASVLLFSTVAVGQGFTAHASVAMAKGAVEGLTRALAAELAPKIRVNAIAPSLVRTPLASGLTANASMAAARSARCTRCRGSGRPRTLRRWLRCCSATRRTGSPAR